MSEYSEYKAIPVGEVPFIDVPVTEQMLMDNSAKFKALFRPIVEGERNADHTITVNQADVALFQYVLSNALERGAKWERASHAASLGLPAEVALLAGLLDMPVNIIDKFAEVFDAAKERANEDGDEGGDGDEDISEEELRAILGLD
jgi:hypothetical protein